MSLLDAQRLFSCQKILFTFHFYTTVPLQGFSHPSYTLEKLPSPALVLSPLSIFLSSSNQPVDLRASKTNIPSLLFLQADSSVLFWEEEMAFSWCFAEHAPLETPWLCLIEEISLRLPDLGLNFPESPFALMEVTQRLLQHCYIFILEQHWKPKLSISHLFYCCIVFSVR